MKRVDMRKFVLGEDAIGAEQTLPLSAIVLPDYQPRTYFDESKIDELVQSIKSQGLLTRLIVRRINGRDKYELVAGGRRYRAATRAGLKEVPVVVKKLTDDEALSIALTENLLREDQNPLEETEGIVRLIALKTGLPVEAIPSLLIRMYNASRRKTEDEQNVLFTDEGKTVKSVFADLGTLGWESFVSSRLPLLNLPENILVALREGKIEYTKAKAIAKLKQAAARADLLEKAVSENLSLTQIREITRKMLKEEDCIEGAATQIASLSKRLKKAELWKREPKKWKKVQDLLQKIETLLQEENLQVEGDSREIESTNVRESPDSE
jgi:ParB family chromosome partitioning protein